MKTSKEHLMDYCIARCIEFEDIGKHAYLFLGTSLPTKDEYMYYSKLKDREMESNFWKPVIFKNVY